MSSPADPGANASVEALRKLVNARRNDALEKWKSAAEALEARERERGNAPDTWVNKIAEG